MNNELISREALREAFKAWKEMDDYYHDTDCIDIPFSEAFDLIDNASTVEPEKVLVANVTFDKDKLKEIVHTEVIEKIKSGELVLKTEERPQGKWIIDNLHNTICNKCGGIRRDNRVEYIAFCNKCGAEMKGGAE